MPQMTIGEIMEKLNSFEDDCHIEVLTTNDMLERLQQAPTPAKFLDGDCGSYRGYYDNVQIGYGYIDEGYNTVGQLKRIVESVLDSKVVFGYKGGDYEINDYTPVWLALHSGDRSNLFVSDIMVINGMVTLIATEGR